MVQFQVGETDLSLLQKSIPSLGCFPLCQVASRSWPQSLI